MVRRIHIVGASGSGTTTLAERIASDFGWGHFDTDNYFWVQTNPPYQEQTPVSERLEKMHCDLSTCNDWVLSGSLCGWGDTLIPYFDLVIFLYIPQEIRLLRLAKREEERYGTKIKPEGELYDHHRVFIEWAKRYDVGGMEVRSKVKHEQWLKEIDCPVLRIEGDISIDEKMQRVKQWTSTH